MGSGPELLAQALVAIQSKGGGLRLVQDGRLDKGTIALQVGNELIVSDQWVNAAMDNPASIHANLAHEIAGHMAYANSLSCVLFETAAAGTTTMSDFDTYRDAYLKFVYPETEIYAELHELGYLSESSIGDDPYVDIIVQARKIEAAYPPEVAELVLGWLRQRCSIDPTLTIDARFYCEAALSPAPE